MSLISRPQADGTSRVQVDFNGRKAKEEAEAFEEFLYTRRPNAFDVELVDGCNKTWYVYYSVRS
jgi:hypothetical protein